MTRRPARLRNRTRALGLAMAMTATSWLAPCSAPALSPPASSPRIGDPGMLQPHTRTLLVDYYEAFLRDQDVDAFRLNASSRYNEGTLARIVQSGDLQARRAAVLALGLYGGFGSNAAVARALKDADPTVRALADNAHWAIWFRADSEENNASLEKIHTLISRGRLPEAIEQANRLIARAPDFAEAYNQKAIAEFFQGKFAESEADCRKVIERNPFHTPAMAGMGKCLLRLGRQDEALTTFRKALAIQPYSQDLREIVAELEAADR